MTITFLGAAKTVTGSCYLVETQSVSFLVDCGMFQGRHENNNANEAPFPFDVRTIGFLLLTHAHIDHSGRIPKLYLDGFRSPVYTQKATAELCTLMWPDSGHIQEMEAEWRSRKNIRAGKAPIEPLYTSADAQEACSLIKPVSYDEAFQPHPDVKVVFRDAGHVLGSAILEIWINENGQTRKIVFSGDLGNINMPILRNPAVIEGADCLIIESTYGDRLHLASTDKADHFVDVINDTIRRGGNVVIPSFAVGRTQEILYDINTQRDILGPKVESIFQTPVVVDSPLAISATQVFRHHPECYDAEAKAYIVDGENLLDFPNLRFTPSMEESKALNLDDEPKIIISSSGMCDAGRIKHHLKHNLWRPESTVMFVGYQAPGTLGRQLVDGQKKVTLFGEEVMVHAQIEVMDGFSGHADRDGLLNWIAAMRQKPEHILIVHGEPEVMEIFSTSIQARFQIKTDIPSFGECLDPFGISYGVKVAQTWGPELVDRRKDSSRAGDRTPIPVERRKPEEPFVAGIRGYAAQKRDDGKRAEGAAGDGQEAVNDIVHGGPTLETEERRKAHTHSVQSHENRIDGLQQDYAALFQSLKREAAHGGTRTMSEFLENKLRMLESTLRHLLAGRRH
jgi:metallo-beta-lactamase family protein